MHILFVTPRFPCPPDRGDKVRPYNFARVLAREHELSLVSLVDTPVTPDAMAQAGGIFQHIRTVHRKRNAAWFQLARNVLSLIPWQVALFHSDTMRRAVEQAVSEVAPDVIYTFHLRMAQYTMELQGPYRILDLTDSVSLFLRRMLPHRPLYFRPLIWREWLAVKGYEAQLATSFDEVWLISKVDADAIPGANNWGNLVILPNGVDTEYFSPTLPEDLATDGVPRIIFVGYMGVESVSAVHNFYRNVFPKVRQRVPTARFVVVGRSPPASVRRLANDPNVEVAGYVADLPTYYRQATVLVAPMRFVVGMQNKILEAMACGVPVVATSFAHEGIDAQPGQGVLVADDDDAFGEGVCTLLLRPEIRREMSRQAREFVVKNYRWERVAEHLRGLSLSGRALESTLGAGHFRNAGRDFR